MSNLVASRMVGAFPLSIATSIALEHLCGVKSEANPEPRQNALPQYSEMWVNLRTLYRNLLGSLDKEAVKAVLPAELHEGLLMEMDTLSALVRDFSQGHTKVVFYFSNYQGLEKRFRMAKLRGDQTDRQLQSQALMRTTFDRFFKAGVPVEHVIKVFDLKLKNERKVKTVIITHYAYDLVSADQFGSLTLLESHTGALKDRDKWYTKYYQGKDLMMIPFTEGLLPVFGDSETFHPLTKSARDQVIDLAHRYHWSSVTKRDKLLYGIDQLKDPYLKEVIRSFFH